MNNQKKERTNGWLPTELVPLGDLYGIRRNAKQNSFFVKVETKDSVQLQDGITKAYFRITKNDTQLSGTNYWKGLSIWIYGADLDQTADYYGGNTKKVVTSPVKKPLQRGEEHNGDNEAGVYFSNFHSHLLRHLKNENYPYVVGWCPWISDPSVLHALQQKKGVTIITQADQKPILVKYPMQMLFDKDQSFFFMQVTDEKGVNEEMATLHGKVMLFLNEKKEPVGLWRGSCNWTVNAFDNNIGEEASFSNDSTI